MRRFTRMKPGMTSIAIMSVAWGAMWFPSLASHSANADYKMVAPYNSNCDPPKESQKCAGKTYCGDGDPANYGSCQVNGGSLEDGTSCAGFRTDNSVQVGSCAVVTGLSYYTFNGTCSFCQVVPCTTGTCFPNNQCGDDGSEGTMYYSYRNNACTN